MAHSGVRPSDIGVGDSRVEGWVFEVGIEVVRRALAHRIGRIADDDVDRGRELPGDAVVVGGEDLKVKFVAVFVDLERVSEHNPGERFVIGGVGVAGDGMVSGLDVDRSDVVREQHDLVGVDL